MTEQESKLVLTQDEEDYLDRWIASAEKALVSGEVGGGFFPWDLAEGLTQVRVGLFAQTLVAVSYLKKGEGPDKEAVELSRHPKVIHLGELSTRLVRLLENR